MSSNLAEKITQNNNHSYQLSNNSRFSGFVDLSGKAQVITKNSSPLSIQTGKIISKSGKNIAETVAITPSTISNVIINSSYKTEKFLVKKGVSKSHFVTYSRFFQFILSIGISATCVIGYNSFDYNYLKNSQAKSFNLSYRDLEIQHAENLPKPVIPKTKNTNKKTISSTNFENIKVSFINGKKVQTQPKVTKINSTLNDNLNKLNLKSSVLPSDNSSIKKVFDVIKSFIPNRSEGLKLALSIVEESKKANYDPLFVAAVIKSESGFNRFATSAVGAKGLMQIMPATGSYVAKFDKFRDKPKGHLTDAGYNLKLGIAYLQYLDDLFDNNKVLTLIAYNWGPTKVANSVEGRNSGVPKEVMNYALKILSDHQKWHKDIVAGNFGKKKLA